jgi:ABC-type sulfate transport system permease component
MGIFFAGKRLKRGAFDDKAAGTLSLVLLVISFMTLSVVYTLNQRQARIGG